MVEEEVKSEIRSRPIAGIGVLFRSFLSFWGSFLFGISQSVFGISDRLKLFKPLY